MKLEYPYTLEPQPEGGFLVQFIDFDEAFTEADTADEAAFNAAEVLSLVLEQRMEDAVEIPKPSPARGCPVARPQASVQAAIHMRGERQTQGKSLADMARALNTSWPAAQRLEQPGANPTLRQLERAAAALGKRLVVGLE
jgi:antitoxin HicB